MKSWQVNEHPRSMNKEDLFSSTIPKSSTKKGRNPKEIARRRKKKKSP